MLPWWQQIVRCCAGTLPGEMYRKVKSTRKLCRVWEFCAEYCLEERVSQLCKVWRMSPGDTWHCKGIDVRLYKQQTWSEVANISNRPSSDCSTDRRSTVMNSKLKNTKKSYKKIVHRQAVCPLHFHLTSWSPDLVHSNTFGRLGLIHSLQITWPFSSNSAALESLRWNSLRVHGPSTINMVWTTRYSVLWRCSSISSRQITTIDYLTYIKLEKKVRRRCHDDCC